MNQQQNSEITIFCLGYPGITLGKQGYLAQKPRRQEPVDSILEPFTAVFGLLLCVVMTHVYPLLVAQLQA